MDEKTKSWCDGIRDMHPSWAYRLWNGKSISGLDKRLYGKMVAEGWKYNEIANYFRLLIVWIYGGIYLDTDCEAVRPLDPLLNYEAFAAPQDNESVDGSPNRLCSAVFGATPRHPWVERQLFSALDSRIIGEAWGVRLMTVSPRDGITEIPTEWVYPWSCKATSEEKAIKPTTLVAHHWVGSWVTK